MSTKVSAIVAVVQDNSIGYKDGNLIFHNREDLMFFSGFTQGKICVVGYNTHLTLPKLSNRTLILDERNRTIDLKWKARFEGKDVVVIGGGATYNKYAPQVEELYITKFEGVGEDKGERVFFDELQFQHLHKRTVVGKGEGYSIYRWSK